MNINKLFPRLTIRAKLAIAFASLAILPLLAVSGFATVITSRYVRALTESTLQHDLEGARAQTEGALHEVERQVAYLARAILGPLLVRSDSAAWRAAERAVSEIFSLSPALFRVKVIGSDGRLLFVVADEDVGTGAVGDLEAGGFYYIQRASVLKSGERLALPVEFRRRGDAADNNSTLSTIAILEPVWGPQGSMLGIVVGEARASVLFSGIEMGSPNLTGTTGLVAGGGLLLYHTNLKNNWGRLLASRTDADLVSELSPEGVAAVLSGAAGTLLVGGRIISYLPLRLTGSGIGPVMLYRIVSVSALEAPVRSLQRGFIAGGSVVLAIVFGLAVLAARQLTEPIYRLREGVRHLARGGELAPLRVETNDELEDLAEDFTVMAKALSEHRSQLEELVAERTRALQEAHSELEDILEYSADAIAGLNVEGRVRIWNRGAETLFGYTASEAVGRHIDDLLGCDASVTETALIQRELDRHGAVVNLLTTRAPKEGDPFPVSLTQAPICDDQGRTVGYSLIIRDNRLQSKLEEQMRRSERYAAVSVMAAGLAHELKNPLAIIDNRVKLMEDQLRETSENGDLLKDLRVVGEHTQRLVDVTRNLLAFGQDDTEDRAPVDLNQVCRHVGGLLERTFATRGIEFETILSEDLPTIIGNEHAIETVCVNLLLNAADATPPGGKVTLATRQNTSEPEVEVEVSDTGPGIPKDLRRRIFEPFFTTKQDDHGTGLGLAVCRNIAERHLGRIWVESASGGGARFIVSFPVNLADRQWTVQPS